MSKLRVGDKVKTADGSYSKVYSFSHKDDSAKATYLQIHTDSMHKARSLEITAKHLIYVFDTASKTTKLSFAQDVKVGDFLVTVDGLPSQVKSIRTVEGHRGLYTPATVSGNILVNGVQASIYTSVDCLDGIVSEETLHWLSHGTMAPYRLYCAVKGGCKNEIYDKTEGLNAWIHFLSSVQHTLLDSPTFIVQIFIVFASVGPFVFFVILGKMLSTSTLVLAAHFVAAVVVFVAWKKTNMNETKDGDDLKKVTSEAKA